MGLLEEAIREHLELQRRHGGDAREIALAEREALEPLIPGQTPDWAQGPGLFDGEQVVAPEARDAAGQDAATAPAPEAFALEAASLEAFAVEAFAVEAAAVDASAADPTVPAAGAHVEQETAELDMSTVLFESPAGEEQQGLEYRASRAPAGTAGLGDPAQPFPEFDDLRARRIVADPPPAENGEPDFEWEIPGVTRSPGAST